MTHDPQQAHRVFAEVADLPESARAAALERLCEGDANLRAEVERLLSAAAEDDPEFFFIDEVPSEKAGDVIGRYTLREELGSGGFGTVWLAEQHEPVKRTVALKIIHVGMDTRQVVARFEQERQALALMDHPNVARVLDAGATLTGRPYFVMDLVRGQPIGAYCDENKLTIESRLELFAQVCNAIQHAHGKGIIHRDLKPANILVQTRDGKPHATVIDFGIAKATSAKLTGRSLLTMQHQVVGTVKYMSPEQAEGSPDIDTRSDVYSLGVVLYELLTGDTPFERETLERAVFGEIQRMIREVDPPSPSARITKSKDTLPSLAAQRGVPPARLRALVRGELDWIVMKALDKDRARRYETANALALDVQRYLVGEPLVAAPPSAAYRLRKFVRRNRGKVIAASLVLLALVLGVIGTTRGMMLAIEEKARADAEARKADETARFALSLFKGIDPHVARGADTRLLLRILDDARGRISSELSGEPEVEAEIRTTLGRAYTQLTRFDDAERELRAAEALRLRLFGEQDRRTLATREAIGKLLVRRGKEAAAESLQRTTLAQAQQALGPEDRAALRTQCDLGASLMRQGKWREAQETLRRTLTAQRARFGAEDADTLLTQLVLGQTLSFLGYANESRELLQMVYDVRHARLGDDAPETIVALDALGIALRLLDRHSESEAAHREALGHARRVYGPEDQQTLSMVNNLAYCLQHSGRTAEAEALYRECLEIRRRKLGPEHVDTLSSLNNLGGLLWDAGRRKEARELFEGAFATERRVLGDDHRLTIGARHLLASAFKSEGRQAEAAELLRQTLEQQRKVLAEDDPTLVLGLYNWAATLQDAGKLAESEAPLREAAAAIEKHGWQSQLFVPAAWNALAKALEARGEHAEADQWFGKALQARRERFKGTHPEIAYSLVGWGAALLERGAADRAESLLREHLALQRKLCEPPDRNLAESQVRLGRCLASLRRFAEGEALLVDACAAYQALGSPGDVSWVARSWLVPLYEAWDKAEPGNGYGAKAEEWKSKASSQPAGPETK